MKKSVSVGVVLSAVVCLAYGCSSDDDDNGSPHAGAAGKGGSGAKGGAGGSSAKGGNAGKGGTAGGGQGGTAGRGGSSGRAGRGGSAGLGGDSSGGGGSDGGYCASEQPSAPLAQCPAVAGGEQRTVDTSCSFEDTCRELDCGGTWSQFTEAGCRKTTCDATSACATGERCLSVLIVGNWDCYPSIYEGCDVSDCSCSCTQTDDCRHPAFCQPASEFTEPFDCPSAGCVEAETFVNALEAYTSGLDPDHLSDADKSVVACQRKAQRELDACNGGGGAGAGGQAGAGAGGIAGQSNGGQAGG
ncbi:MAG TPA: hypothetical protein VNN72_09640 [Polyangiaceae bacterium]|nr:hypothetical protein [Polyangiaceae bacterium]